MLKIKCNNCNEFIQVTDNILEFIEESRQKGKKFIMIPCDKCGLDFSFNPMIDEEVYREELVWRCPTSGCHGYVSYINKNETPYKDGKSFYGCGETGKMWHERESFYKDIENIIKQYAYRSKCYEYKNNEWLPHDCDIDDLIDLEEDKRWD